ncbi:MAG: hypothetical protein QW835_02565 [Candidatus Hadarchaeum sp.]
MKVKVLRPFRIAGKEYHSGTVELDDSVAARLIERGLAERAEEAPESFDDAVDISEVLPRSGSGEGTQYSIESLVGQPIKVISAAFDKGRSGRLEGKSIATVQIETLDGDRGWFSTWSGPMIDQLKQLQELNAFPVKCKIEERRGSSGYRYYILASAKVQARDSDEQR